MYARLDRGATNRRRLQRLTRIGDGRWMFVTHLLVGILLLGSSAACRQPTANRFPASLSVKDSITFVAAHRGFQHLFPENTLVGITGAFNLGADAVDLDVRATKDSVLILMHDPIVDRTTNGTGAVDSLTFAQIAALDACSKFSSQWGPCPVPTLRSALAAAKGRGLVILELKAPLTAAGAAALVSEVQRDSMERQVLLTCINRTILLMFRRLDSLIPVGYIDSQLPAIADLTGLGSGAQAVVDEHALLADTAATDAFVTVSDSNKIGILAWTISSQQEADSLAAIGIRRMISNVPLDKHLLRE